MIPSGLTEKEAAIYAVELRQNPLGGTAGAMRAVELDRAGRANGWKDLAPVAVGTDSGSACVFARPNGPKERHRKPENAAELGDATIAKACEVADCRRDWFFRSHLPEAIRARRIVAACLRPIIGRLPTAAILQVAGTTQDVMFRDCSPKDRMLAEEFAKTLDVHWQDTDRNE